MELNFSCAWCTGPPNLHTYLRHPMDDKISAMQTGSIAESLRARDVDWQLRIKIIDSAIDHGSVAKSLSLTNPFLYATRFRETIGKCLRFAW